jgi:hypothetical protein
MFFFKLSQPQTCCRCYFLSYHFFSVLGVSFSLNLGFFLKELFLKYFHLKVFHRGCFFKSRKFEIFRIFWVFCFLDSCPMAGLFFKCLLTLSVVRKWRRVFRIFSWRHLFFQLKRGGRDIFHQIEFDWGEQFLFYGLLCTSFPKALLQKAFHISFIQLIKTEISRTTFRNFLFVTPKFCLFFL